MKFVQFVVAIEVWGDGTAVRVFTYVDDLVDGIYTLMQSDPSAALRLGSGQGSGQRLEGPVNPSARLRAGLGSDERVSVAELVQTVIEVSGKRINVKYVPGPVGVHARNPSTGLRAPLQQGTHQVVGLAGEGVAESMS